MAHGAAELKITGGLSMLCFGYLELELLGEICRQIMDVGAIRIVDLLGGETKEYGRSY